MPLSKTTPEPVKTYGDFIQPFMIDHSAIRGRLVRLEDSLTTILGTHNYPVPVLKHLAEQLVLASLLSATLTQDGILTVQVKGDGPVRFMIVDVLAGGTIRGYAQIEEDAFKKSRAKKFPLAKVLGKGYLAVTYDQGGDTQRYQGIVELKGDTLSEAFKGYFSQSQQAEVAVHVAVAAPDKKHKTWRAGGILIERMPLAGGHETESTPEEQEDLWKRTQLFMRTIKDAEMLDAGITPQNLLYRLFNEDGVWVYKLQPLKAGCRCSRDRIKTVLKTLAKEELLSSLTQDKLSVHCEFCNKREIFTRADINRLYRKPTVRKKAQKN
jgi:molecular chaperone Hsp33